MNAEMTPEEVTVRLQLALDGATGLPPEGIDRIEMLIRAGERLMAFEALCTQIDEYEISLDPGLVQRLIEVGLAVGAEERYSDLLKGAQVMRHQSATTPSRTGKSRWSPLWWALCQRRAKTDPLLPVADSSDRRNTAYVEVSVARRAAGVSQPRVLRGRALSSVATSSR